MKKITAAVFSAALVLALAAGSCDEKGTGDAPVGETHEGERQVINMPNTYSNVAAACLGPNGIYVITADRHEVVPNDPNCEEGGLLNDE